MKVYTTTNTKTIKVQYFEAEVSALLVESKELDEKYTGSLVISPASGLIVQTKEQVDKKYGNK